MGTFTTVADNCAYVRPEPGANTEPLACVPNGTQVTWTGRQEANGGFTWVEVGYPTEDSLRSGWMAYGVVAWDFSPNASTIEREVALYGANRASIMRWLSPHTPILLDHEEGGWAWVQLPNGEWGWVKSGNLSK